MYESMDSQSITVVLLYWLFLEISIGTYCTVRSRRRNKVFEIRNGPLDFSGEWRICSWWFSRMVYDYSFAKSQRITWHCFPLALVIFFQEVWMVLLWRKKTSWQKSNDLPLNSTSFLITYDNLHIVQWLSVILTHTYFIWWTFVSAFNNIHCWVMTILPNWIKINLQNKSL